MTEPHTPPDQQRLIGAAPGRDDELVEKMARAIYEAEGGTAWERLYNGTKDDYRNTARATLSVARPAIKEECVDAVFEVGDHASASAYADAIRAMK
jgi:hypothetical protein